MVKNYEEEYRQSLEVVESAVERIRYCQYRVERAEQGIKDTAARSNATQRKARNFLEREKRIVEQAYDSRDSAICSCRRSYNAFCASKWAKQWGLPQELADEVAYWVFRR